ncbi:MAG TPA: hypothetical protein VGZ47_18295 [Gemmataceae bacterium]|jgi:hypothetical protein|nr:hypothetical protein [Gemmataceae bacterium]
MGLEFYITRAEFWADNKGHEITAEEWQTYLASDPELKPDARHGEFGVIWLGRSAYDDPWLNWFRGNVYTKWPDTALYRKMLRIARALGAQVQDDDGNVYTRDTGWNFEPNDERDKIHRAGDDSAL